MNQFVQKQYKITNKIFLEISNLFYFECLSRIENKVFVALAKATENLFPSELASIYYSPYKRENVMAVQKSGSLWAHFNYTLEKLRSKNLLERRKSPKQIQNPDEPLLSMILKNYHFFTLI